MDAATDKKLRELIDRQEIWQVLLRYCRGVDRMDNELLRSCYFADAIDDHGRFIGTVEEFIPWVTAAGNTCVTQQHCLMNHSCELDGDDAYAETYYQSIGVRRDPPHLVSIGRYLDHFQRRDGEWRIAARVVMIEKVFGFQDNDTVPNEPLALQTGNVQRSRRDRTDASYDCPRPRSADSIIAFDPALGR